MKAFLYTKDENDNPICPVCKSILEPMEHIGFAMGREDDRVFSLPVEQVTLTTKDEHSRNHKSGRFYMCNHCKELMFIYDQSDFRRCSDCQHCGSLKYRGGVFGNDGVTEATGCKWFNVPIGIGFGGGIDFNKRWSDLQNFHCAHIDQPLPEHDSSMRCFLCKHYSKKAAEVSYLDADERCDVHCPITTFTNKVQRMIGICAEFEADYEKYKTYRASFEDMLIVPEDIICIPEFDKRIEQEEKQNA